MRDAARVTCTPPPDPAAWASRPPRSGPSWSRRPRSEGTRHRAPPSSVYRRVHRRGDADRQPITPVSLGFGVTLGGSATFLEPKAGRALKGVRTRGTPGWARVQDGRFGEHSPGAAGTTMPVTVSCGERQGTPRLAGPQAGPPEQRVQPPAGQDRHGAPLPSRLGCFTSGRARTLAPWPSPRRLLSPPPPSGHLVDSPPGGQSGWPQACDGGGAPSLPSPRPQAVTRGRSLNTLWPWEASPASGLWPAPRTPSQRPRCPSSICGSRGPQETVVLTAGSF